MKSSLPKHLRSITAVLPLGVDLTKFTVGNKVAARQTLGLRQDASYGMYVGRLVPSKGVLNLVSSVSLICRTLPDFHLVIVGEGPMRRSLIDLVAKLGIQSNVTFAGQVDQSAMPTFYNAADLLIHPSLRDLAPMVVLESLACGTPVIASPVGYIPEVALGVGGVAFVSAPTPVSIAEVTKSVLESGTSSREIDRKGIERYGWDSLAPRYLNLYRALFQ
jgi:glycosyltransferase involved in cell wall biosynthesis